MATQLAPQAQMTYRSSPNAAEELDRALGVSIYMITFGRFLQLPREQLDLLGMLGLLLDVGKVRLPQHAVSIGTKGHVTAEIQARVIEIEGEVEGQLQAEELIVLHKSARVRGDLVAPRVVLEDGAKFKGTIDMEPKAAAATGRARGDVEARSEKPAGATSPTSSPSSTPAATGSAAAAPRPS